MCVKEECHDHLIACGWIESVEMLVVKAHKSVS